MMMNKQLILHPSIDELSVVGSIATMPSRIHTFAKMLPGILAQVDVLYIYLDGYKKIPEPLLLHPKCRPVIPTDDRNLHTSNRFLAARNLTSDAVIAFFDDDILYPANYITIVKAALHQYGHRSIVGFHASNFCPPHTSYANNRVNYHFAHTQLQDQIVHILGAGTAAFLSSVFCPDPRNWKYHNMADLYLAAEALKSNLNLISLKREKNWLIPLEQNQKDSIWRSVKKDDAIQTSFMNDILTQYANTRWRSWWSVTQNKIDDEHKIIKVVNHFKHVINDTSLTNNEQYVPYAVGDRTRYATCSGVAWLSDQMFVTVNLYGQNLQVYQLSDNTNDNSISLIHEMKDGMQFPESVSISPNKKMMAISHTMSSTKGISIHNIESGAGFDIKESKDIRKGTYHSLCFSPNSRFLAATEIGNVGYVEIIDTITFKSTFVQPSRLSPLRPKSVAISPTGELIVIISGAVVKQKNEDENSASVITLHKFDQEMGVIEDTILFELKFTDGRYVSIEDSCIIPSQQNRNKFNLICVDQANDKLQNFLIDTDASKIIQYQGHISDNVSFPHGIDISPSGRSLAVANYGDNSIRILNI